MILDPDSPEGPAARRPPGAAARLAAQLRRHWLAALLAMIVLLVVIVTLVRRRSGGEEEEVAAVVAVRTAVAAVRPLDVTLAALGTVAPRPGHQAAIAAPAATRVSKVYVALGDHVAAGQPLVALDRSVFAAQAGQASAAYAAAQKAYERARRLVAEGISARKDEEQAAAELAQARAALQEAQRTEALGVLRSPIAGVVTELDAALSAPVEANQPLVRVVDPRALEVLFHLAPDEAARVRPGAAVELTSGADSSRTYLGRGQVTGVSAAVDSTGSVAVRAAIAAPTRPLKSGETVSGAIVVAEHPRALVVPAAALVPDGSATQVFVVDGQGVAHARPVAVGARSGDDAEIVSGLRPGELVVAEGAYGVTDGARVQRAAP